MIKVDSNKCDLCGSCVGICPENAIELYENHLVIDEDICTECGRCVKICPVQALENISGEKTYDKK